MAEVAVPTGCLGVESFSDRGAGVRPAKALCAVAASASSENAASCISVDLVVASATERDHLHGLLLRIYVKMVAIDEPIFRAAHSDAAIPGKVPNKGFAYGWVGFQLSDHLDEVHSRDKLELAFRDDLTSEDNPGHSPADYGLGSEARASSAVTVQPGAPIRRSTRA
jgi:hypothetical protein